MYMLNMVIILIVMYCNVVTAIDKIPTYLLRFNMRHLLSTILSDMPSLEGRTCHCQIGSSRVWCARYAWQMDRRYVHSSPLERRQECLRMAVFLTSECSSVCHGLACEHPSPSSSPQSRHQDRLQLDLCLDLRLSL